MKILFLKLLPDFSGVNDHFLLSSASADGVAMIGTEKFAGILVNIFKSCWLPLQVLDTLNKHVMLGSHHELTWLTQFIVEIIAWTSNLTPWHCVGCNYSMPNFNSSLKLGHDWVITSHSFIWMWLHIHVHICLKKRPKITCANNAIKCNKSSRVLHQQINLSFNLKLIEHWTKSQEFCCNIDMYTFSEWKCLDFE